MFRSSEKVCTFIRCVGFYFADDRDKIDYTTGTRPLPGILLGFTGGTMIILGSGFLFIKD
ncbi:MAG: hypothetical protein RXR36_02150 [Nitrososphaeria archaeon]